MGVWDFHIITVNIYSCKSDPDKFTSHAYSDEAHNVHYHKSYTKACIHVHVLRNLSDFEATYPSTFVFEDMLPLPQNNLITSAAMARQRN